jgi:LDH2 family malate/lactate/ureidoglycolate dehydrogenase
VAATETIDVQPLKQLAADALHRAGVSAEDAGITAGILVDAESMGITTHGLIRVPQYVDRIRRGGIDPKAPIRIEQKSPSLAIVDGADGVGTAVGGRALEAALDMAAATGIAWVGCRRSNHCGALAPYALRACEAGRVLIAGTNASTTMIPWGGSERRMGNNPLCIAAPGGDGMHVILDMAMSVAARGKIRAALAEGTAIPEGWAVDAAGLPTTDPARALAGSLLAVGGYKGSGLSLAVDMLSGVLTGATFLTDVSSWSEAPGDPSGLGHFFLLIDPGRLIGAQAFAAAMERFKTIVLDTPRADAAIPVLLPGQREQERRRAALRDGIDVPGDLLAAIRELASG